MNRLQRVLNERSMELLEVVADEASLSRVEAAAFLREAWGDLLESCRWYATSDPGHLPAEDPARAVLGGMNARRIGPRAGLSEQETWAGLRALVPAVLEHYASFGATSHRIPCSAPSSGDCMAGLDSMSAA